MTKAEYISLAHHSLEGGQPPGKSKFHPRVIEENFALAFNNVVSQIEDTSILDSLAVVRRNVPVLYDEDLALYYSELPISLLNTVYGSALRMVSPMKDQVNAFFLRPNHSQPVMSRLDVDGALFGSTARVEGDRVYYDKFDQNLIKNGVLMKLLAGFDDLEDDDDIDMPGGKDSFIFMQVLDQMRLMLQIPKAYKNNNNDNGDSR